MAKLYSSLQKDKANIQALADRYHATNVRVFGSVVRGEERDGSDIDFLVDFLPGTTLLDQVGFIDALSALLGRKVDVISERALNKYLRNTVLKEAMPL